MSRIAADSRVDKLDVSISSILPKKENVTVEIPVVGSIAYDIPSECLWFSTPTEWLPINSGLLGFPFTNPPFPALPPNGGVPIFNASTQTWTVYPLSGDVTMTPGGVATVTGLRGNTVGPFTALSSGEVLTWDGTKWINLPTGGASPTGPAGGALNGTYPNPGIAPTGVTAGIYGGLQGPPVISVLASGQIASVNTTLLNAGVINNTLCQSVFNVAAGAQTVLGFVLPEGVNQYVLHVAWNDSTFKGGSYDFSGAVLFIAGVISDPTYVNPLPPFDTIHYFGNTLQTVYGHTPTASATINQSGGNPSLILTFQQDTWNYNLNAHLIFVNSTASIQ